MSILQEIKCIFNFHNDEIEKKVVYKDKNQKTANIRSVCKVCGRKTEWCGVTTFGISFIK